MESKEKQQYHQSIKVARKAILDLLESVYGHTPQWRKVRSQMLKIFGRDGLEKVFTRDEIFSFKNKEKQNF